MELTPWRFPNGTYAMEVTSLNLHYRSYLRNVHHGSYQVKRTPWKLPHGTYTMEVP